MTARCCRGLSAPRCDRCLTAALLDPSSVRSQFKHRPSVSNPNRKVCVAGLRRQIEILREHRARWGGEKSSRAVRAEGEAA